MEFLPVLLLLKRSGRVGQVAEEQKRGSPHCPPFIPERILFPALHFCISQSHDVFTSGRLAHIPHLNIFQILYLKKRFLEKKLETKLKLLQQNKTFEYVLLSLNKKKIFKNL